MGERNKNLFVSNTDKWTQDFRVNKKLCLTYTGNGEILEKLIKILANLLNEVGPKPFFHQNTF